MNVLRVSFAYDAGLVNTELRDLLKNHSQFFEIIAFDPLQPIDIALCDPFSHGHDPWNLLHTLVQNPNLKRVAVYVNVIFQCHVAQLLDLGVQAALSNSLTGDDLAAALMKIYAGQKFCSQSLSVVYDEGSWPGRFQGLTAKESETLALICQGLGNSEISARMNISLNTLKSYIRTTYRKIGARNRAQAILWGVKYGFNLPASVSGVSAASRLSRGQIDR